MSDGSNKYWAEVHQPESDSFKGKPHGRIQWKGTDVCMDVHCVCGSHGHIDADFFYHYECKGCGRKYAVGEHVNLIELNPEHVAFIEAGGACGFISDPETADDSTNDAAGEQK